MITHEVKTMVKQRVYRIGCGYEDLNDRDQLRKDSMFKIANNMRTTDTCDMASALSLCRMEQRITREQLFDITRVAIDQFIGSYKKVSKEMMRDFDTADDEITGLNLHFKNST